MESAIGLAILAAILWATIGRGFMDGLKGDEAPIRTENIKRWPDIGDFAFEIVGESNYQKALKRLAGTHGDQSPDKEFTALIFPESNNPHDKSAVRVDIDGTTVGYLSRADARSFRRRLAAQKIKDQPTCCGALVVGGFRMPNGLQASYGVRLDIKPFNN
jgi:hypothetical protein